MALAVQFSVLWSESARWTPVYIEKFLVRNKFEIFMKIFGRLSILDMNSDEYLYNFFLKLRNGGENQHEN